MSTSVCDQNCRQLPGFLTNQLVLLPSMSGNISKGFCHSRSQKKQLCFFLHISCSFERCKHKVWVLLVMFKGSRFWHIACLIHNPRFNVDRISNLKHIPHTLEWWSWQSAQCLLRLLLFLSWCLEHKSDPWSVDLMGFYDLVIIRHLLTRLLDIVLQVVLYFGGMSSSVKGIVPTALYSIKILTSGQNPHSDLRFFCTAHL